MYVRGYLRGMIRRSLTSNLRSIYVTSYVAIYLVTCAINLFLQVFQANYDRNNIIVHPLQPPIVARYVQFIPRTYFGWMSMRAEIYGCKKGLLILNYIPFTQRFSCVTPFYYHQQPSAGQSDHLFYPSAWGVRLA